MSFPASIQEFADNFQQLQEHRHKADYDPDTRFSKADAETWYEIAKLSIASLRSASNVDKKAFAAWVLISSQGARQARQASATT